MMIVTGGIAFLVAVIALCTTFVFPPHPSERSDAARPRMARDDIGRMKMACKLFRLDCGRWPDESAGLNALLQNPGITHWQGPYVERLAPDPWGRPYHYAFNANADSNSSAAIRITSVGPDGRSGTEDDIGDR